MLHLIAHASTKHAFILFYFFIELRRDSLVLKLEMVMEKKTFSLYSLEPAKERVVNVIFTCNFILLRDLIVTASLCKVV
jgi:hypothetical protein